MLAFFTTLCILNATEEEADMGEFTITRIVLAHHFIAPPGWSSDEYALSRQHHGIVYVFGGEAEYRMGSGEILLLQPGDCLYVPRGTVYITRCKGAEDFVHMTVNFDILEDGQLFSVPTRLRFHAPTRFEQLFSTLVRHWTTRHPYYRERCIGILYEMAYLILRETSATPRQYLEKLQPARDYLDAHFCEDFPMEQLPGICGLSATYFHRLFRRVFHETPAEYRTRLRMAKATDLLLSGVYTIEQCGALCGYGDPAYFSRMFRKTMGQSPSQFLKSHKEEHPNTGDMSDKQDTFL